MIIRYRGGPLNRRSFTGPSQQPPYRDAAGNVLDRPHGLKLTGDQLADIVSRATYVYDAQHCEYVLIGDLYTQTSTARIHRLLDQAADNPANARHAEAEIQEIEALTTWSQK